MSMVGLILVAQAAAPAAATALPPDIEIRAHAEARSVKIRSQGTSGMTLHAEPGEAAPVRSARSAPAGASSYRNLTIELHGSARLTSPKPATAIDNATGDPE